MNPEESLVWKGSPSQWTNCGRYLVCVLLVAGVIAAYHFSSIGPTAFYGLAIPAILAFAFWLGTRTHVYQITTERVLETTGILSRRTSELELYRVRDYQVDEPFWLRLGAALFLAFLLVVWFVVAITYPFPPIVTFGSIPVLTYVLFRVAQGQTYKDTLARPSRRPAFPARPTLPIMRAARTARSG